MTVHPPARAGARCVTALAASLAALLVTGCLPPAGDEAGVPTPGDTPVEGDDAAIATVRQAAAATLAEGGAEVTVRLADEDAGTALTLAVTDDFDADRRRLEPEGADETLLVDGSEVFVRSAAVARATWARFDLDEVAGGGTAATEDLRLLPLTDSAGVLRTLADADGEARADGERYVVRLSVDEARGLVGSGEDWIERYTQTGIDEVDVAVTLDGGRVGEVSYTVPTAADRGLQQGDQVAGEEAEGEAGAGLRLTISYEAGGGGEVPDRPADGEVADVDADAVADLLEWSPRAGTLPDTGSAD